MRKRVVAALTTVALLPAAVAAAGLSPDPGFGDDGAVIVGSAKVDWFSDVTSVDDGYLVAGAWGGDRIVVAKYDTAGVKDFTFGDNGRLIVDLGESARGVQIIERHTGDFLVTAATNSGFAQLVVTADGELNRDYGRRGVVKQRTGPYRNIVTVIDGERRSVVAVGELTTKDDYRSRIHVWRFTRAGNRDRSFLDGDVTASPQRVNEVRGIATDGADRVWLVTSQLSDRDRRAGISLVRISVNGVTVRTLRRVSVWDEDGTFPIGLTRVGTGRYVVGVTGARSPRLGAVAFGAKGQLVRGYGEGGVTTTRCSIACYPMDQYVDDQDRLTMVGAVDVNKDNRWVVDDTWAARFTASGDRDTAFMNGWEGVMPVGGGFDVAYGVDVDDQGRLVLAGRARDDAYLARLAP